MSRYIDLTGVKIGKFKFLKLSYIKHYAYWLCRCDCGNEKVMRADAIKCGQIKSCGCSTKQLIAQALMGEKNPAWTGNKVQYGALHQRIRKEIKRPIKCTFCKKKKKLNLANISQKYKHTLDDWMYLCSKCHQRYDHNWTWKNKKWFKKCKICKKELEVNTDNFKKYNDENKGWFSYCKKCSIKYTSLKK